MTQDFGKHMKDVLTASNPRNVPTAIGLAWYQPDTYEACLKIFDDASDLIADYKSWLEKALAYESQLKAQRIKVVRVNIDPVEFPKWCKSEGYTRIDKHARMFYSNLKAMEALRDQK